MLPPPERLIQNRKPQFGTFKGCPKKLDIRGLATPFGGIPLPRFISNLRIKSTLAFVFSLGRYFGVVDFFDGKIFGYAEVTLWSKENGRKYSYRSIMGPRRRFIPHNVEAGFCASFRKSRYIRASWDHKHDKFSMIFNLKGDSVRPQINAAFVAKYSDTSLCEITSVMPAPTKQRCTASYMANFKIHGSISIGKSKTSEASNMNDADGYATFRVNRAYYNFYTITEGLTSSGQVDGHDVAIFLAGLENDATEGEKYNENILIVDGQPTPLPPVKITHPFGYAKNWIIQDTENMVDLTFKPTSDNFRDMTLFIIHTQEHSVFGTFEGTVKTKDGKDIDLQDFCGLARNQMLRL